MNDKNFEQKNFDQKKYIKDYQKEHYKQFKAKIKNEEMEELNKLLTDKKMNKTEFVLNAKFLLESGIMMGKSEKIKKIDKLIDEIINNGIEAYVSQFDENVGLSVEDWKNGYKNTIVTTDGRVLKYISYSNFKDLYSNFKYDLNQATDVQLDNILNYLNEEKKYTDYNDLDRECYDLDEFE